MTEIGWAHSVEPTVGQAYNYYYDQSAATQQSDTTVLTLGSSPSST